MPDLIVPSIFGVALVSIVAGTWLALGLGAALIAFGLMALVAFAIFASA